MAGSQWALLWGLYQGRTPLVNKTNWLFFSKGSTLKLTGKPPEGLAAGVTLSGEVPAPDPGQEMGWQAGPPRKRHPREAPGSSWAVPVPGLCVPAPSWFWHPGPLSP